jgi:D-proline reductase (dithiol) PrdB
MNEAAQTQPIEYMARSRAYYRAQGYKRDYVWAHFEDVPFARLRKPLRDCTVALLSTSSPSEDATTQRFSGRMEVFSGASDPPPERMFTDDLSWDKDATHTDDLGSYFPIAALREIAEQGVVGSVARRYHCVPTVYSHRATNDVDAPLIVRRCIEDGVDAAILVPL